MVQVKKSQKRYNDLNHPYELNATNRTTVELDESVSTKSIKLDYKFENLKSVSLAKNECCKDVIAIVMIIEEEIECLSKKKDEKYKKREIQLIDNTETMITLTLWGDHAENFAVKEGGIIVLKRAKINIYNDIVKLATTNSTIISFDHECEERTQLEEYWKKKYDDVSSEQD